MPARSTTYALCLALGYGAIAATYILVSTPLAAERATSIEELQSIEVQKGLLYVAVTTLLAYVASRYALARLERNHAELQQRERALVASQGKVLAGAMAAAVAHDANNVLFALLSDFDVFEQAEPGQRNQTLAQLRTSLQRLVELNRRLLVAARPDAVRQEPAGDLAAIVRDSIASVRSHQSLRRCRIVCRGAESLPMRLEPLLVHQIVTNLTLNAGEANQGQGNVEVVLQATDNAAILEVHDDGPGIPLPQRHEVLHGMKSSKPEGSGLGLFSARACAERMGGNIEVLDSPLGGALFRVRLPRQRP